MKTGEGTSAREVAQMQGSAEVRLATQERGVTGTRQVEGSHAGAGPGGWAARDNTGRPLLTWLRGTMAGLAASCSAALSAPSEGGRGDPELGSLGASRPTRARVLASGSPHTEHGSVVARPPTCVAAALGRQLGAVQLDPVAPGGRAFLTQRAQRGGQAGGEARGGVVAGRPGLGGDAAARGGGVSTSKRGVCRRTRDLWQGTDNNNDKAPARPKSARVLRPNSSPQGPSMPPPCQHHSQLAFGAPCPISLACPALSTPS